LISSSHRCHVLLTDFVPFASVYGCVNRTSHPYGSSGSITTIFALAIQLPQKHLGTDLRPIVGQFYGFCIAVPDPCGSYVGRFISFGTNNNGKRHGVQSVFDGSKSNPRSGLLAVAKFYVKQRSIENCSPVFSMWKQARASLCATALMATMLLRLAFLR
jgi:hypothetical protein